MGKKFVIDVRKLLQVDIIFLVKDLFSLPNKLLKLFMFIFRALKLTFQVLYPKLEKFTAHCFINKSQRLNDQIKF
jgi:hypothetical protein